MSDYKNDTEVRPRLDSLEIRKMGLLLLDNFEGVPFVAYEYLVSLLKKTNNDDILEHVDIYKDAKRHCAYIGEDYAEEELAKIEESIKAKEKEISKNSIEDTIDADAPIIDDMSANDMKFFVDDENRIYADMNDADM